ncbi:MAG: DUF2784 domain-containing protein [Desulfobacterales bacterium]
MIYRLLANLVVVIHLFFVLFAVFGALLLIRWRKIIWLHIPAAAWAVWIEFSGRICPLTPLENWLRLEGTETGYSGDFVRHYLLPLLYPASLTREIQIILGILAAALNMAIYGYVFLLRRKRFDRKK